MIDITDRVLNAELRGKITTAEEAALHIGPNMNVGTSGFTPSGYPKAVPVALAERMKKEPFKINLWTGASVGPELDEALANVDGVNFRMPYQTNNAMRNAINANKVQYQDLHLSEVGQLTRTGMINGGTLDVAIVEACMITKEGYIVPTTSLGNSASYVKQAKKVIVEVNTSQPVEFFGMHDVIVPEDPPYRMPFNIVASDTRIGKPYIECPLDKIVAVVPCDVPDNTRPLGAIDDDSKAMSKHLLDFLDAEIAAGRMPKNLLPLQSGVGSVANAVIGGFVDSDKEHLTVYTEVIQDGMFDLIDAGKLDFASGTALSPSPDGQKKLYGNFNFYAPKLLLRPQEISNSPEVVRRIGVIAMNTAIECDIYGNVNSTRINGSKLMNGIGGSGDFARSGYLSVFFTVSSAKKGAVSSIVPMVSHQDHGAQDVDLIVTERGVADLRGKSAKQRAQAIIAISSPEYQAQLQDYFDRACAATKNADKPHLLAEALSWHVNALEKGTMKK